MENYLFLFGAFFGFCTALFVITFIEIFFRLKR